ncbi:MAG: RNA polymerase factor sigma-54 [Candidatus Cloacimonetes bacterium]|nr:RNA polymerase factor sigma-54 [Candidatus Cloacimonadota bacterium]
MKLNQQLSIKQVQSLRLTPQLQLAVKILQANRVELSEMVEQELMENPVLEVSGSTEEVDSYEAQPEESVERSELLGFVKDFEKYFQESQGAWTSAETASNEDKPSFEEFVHQKKTLNEELTAQFHLSTKDPMEQKIGTYLIASLDSSGYLREPVSRIASALMIDEERVEKALYLLQSLEPPGVGARDLRECLLLQYYAQDMHDDLVYAIISDHLEDLGANRIREISRVTGASFQQIEEATEKIRQFNPKPAQGYLMSEAPAEGITPDVFLEFKEGEVIVTLNDYLLPNLMISPWYQERIQNAEGLSQDELLYLKQKLDSAIWFRQCIEKRNETIWLVAKCIFEIQKDFFSSGISRLRPLTLADVAVRIERHEATVSRVVNGKYAQTPSGIFELKFFFSGGLMNDEGEMVSSRHIREILQQAIQEEDPKRPISDQMLAQLLKARGIDIARRTVTKYREMMGIQSSSKRKKFV